MLAQFSWLQFLIAAAVMSFLWYAAVLLVFFRQELGVLFGGRAALAHGPDGGLDLGGGIASDDLMGKSRLPEGMSKVSTSDFSFAAVSGNEQVGLVPDVLEELKTVFLTLAGLDGKKSDFFSLMVGVREQFPGIASSPSIGRINAYIRDHAPFDLSTEELENLWD